MSANTAIIIIVTLITVLKDLMSGSVTYDSDD